MARNSEKARFRVIEKAGRIQFSNPGDSKEAILMACAGGNHGKLNKEDDYERKVIALLGKGGRIHPIPWKDGKFPRPARPALTAEVQANGSKSPQEACQVDNQQKDMRAAVDTAVLKRSVDTNIYINPQKVSDSRPSNEAGNIYKQGTSTSVPRRSADMSIHSIVWRPIRSQVADPPTKQGACCDRPRQALMLGQVDTGFQFLCVSKELGTNVKANKIFIFYLTTSRSQRVASVLLTTTTSSGQGKKMMS